ncbi:hypothetical protein, partial [Pseudorhodobacter sp. E13]|uniref:hypothetical protein n=1 Tax=Pseudorhodobacter sp. E13 TaxID=2487931 RepID=UPI001F2D3B50
TLVTVSLTTSHCFQGFEFIPIIPHPCPNRATFWGAYEAIPQRVSGRNRGLTETIRNGFET